MGKKGKKKNMIYCRRCGKRTYHIRHHKCADCGFGKSARLREYKWNKKQNKKKF